VQVIREETRKLGGSNDLSKPEVQEEIARKVQQRTQGVSQQQALPGIDSEESEVDRSQRINDIVKTVSDAVVKLTIDIPQVVVLPTREVNYGFNDFDLQQLQTINYPPVSEELLLQHLEGDQERHAIHFGGDQVHESRPEDYIVRNLMDRNEIDYDSHAALLYKLSGQVVTHLNSKWQDDQKVENILLYYQKQLCEFIWVQMKANLWSSPTDYQGQVTQGFEVLEPNVYTMAGGETRRDFRAPITDKQSIKKMVFTGFKRCCYTDQKFDSVDGELMFARVLEADDSVLKWMKPASGKLRIEYKQGQRYEPDFVVETTDECLLVEVKRRDEMDSADVQSKARAAKRWCQFANEHAGKYAGKPWSYLLIPHDEILSNSSLKVLSGRFK
jgi:type III restriction enzyme